MYVQGKKKRKRETINLQKVWMEVVDPKLQCAQRQGYLAIVATNWALEPFAQYSSKGPRLANTHGAAYQLCATFESVQDGSHQKVKIRK